MECSFMVGVPVNGNVAITCSARPSGDAEDQDCKQATCTLWQTKLAFDNFQNSDKPELGNQLAEIRNRLSRIESALKKQEQL